jgi:hypothetical protein
MSKPIEKCENEKCPLFSKKEFNKCMDWADVKMCDLHNMYTENMLMYACIMESANAGDARCKLELDRIAFKDSLSEHKDYI